LYPRAHRFEHTDAYKRAHGQALSIYLAAALRETHAVCDEHNDVASASLIENWIDEAERRTWFLFEATRVARE